MQDNIVDTFVPGGILADGTVVGDFDITDDTITDVVIAVPTRELTITIDFPNAVADYAADYQDMKVEITGNIDGTNQTVTYDLGGNMTDGAYVVTEDRLVLNDAYTVTVSGEGYRTARYTVTMTDDKQLKFWNNVMDEAQVVEIGKIQVSQKLLSLQVILLRITKSTSTTSRQLYHTSVQKIS